jgi:hypothetical protein
LWPEGGGVANRELIKLGDWEGRVAGKLVWSWGGVEWINQCGREEAGGGV